MSVIVSNKIVLNAAQAREETLDGRKYLVVPTVVIVDGVLTANRGSLHYPPEVNSKTPSSWNHMPVVVYHPEVNGELVSARTPQIADKRKIGYVFNASYTAPKVGVETWIDELKADQVDDRIVKAIKAGQTLEISAGFELDYREEAGEYNGDKYTGVVINARPDHLAILPDKIGACDVKKGCGCGVNVANEAKEVNPLVANEASFARIQRGIQAAMEKATGDYTSIYDVYSDFFVYGKGYGEGRKLFKKGYSSDKDGKVTLADGEPAEVKWVMEYRDTAGKFVGNTSQDRFALKEPDVADNRDSLITEILACNAGFDKADLEGMKEPGLIKIRDHAKKAVAANPAPQPPPAPPATPSALEAFMVANNIQPTEILALVNGGRQVKSQLVANILEKTKDFPDNRKFPEAWLNAQEIPALQAIDANVTPPAQPPVVVGNAAGWGQSNWFGQAVGNAAPSPTTQAPLAPVDPFAPSPAK